jgi:hypothetical protein
MAFGSRTWSFALIVAVGVLPALLFGVERAEFSDAVSKTVEMFAAMEAGQIDVKLIPKDSTQCRVLIENKTDKPLTVQLPDAFAGVPVLAQFGGGMGGMGGGGMGGMGGGGGGMAGGSQGMGGGMGGMGGGGMGGGGMGGMGGGMGMMNIAPEKVAKFKVVTVCLEHGKKDPRPGIPYVIKPIDQFTDKPQVHELCRMLGKGVVSQRVAQVAAWHLNSDMSWQELAAKYIKRGPIVSPYFSQMEIRGGMQAASIAAKLSEQRASEKEGQSLGDSLSQN